MRAYEREQQRIRARDRSWDLAAGRAETIRLFAARERAKPNGRTRTSERGERLGKHLPVPIVQ
jgi:hypothetical protein